MDNPWINLNKRPPFILDIDKQWLEDYEKNLQTLISRKNAEIVRQQIFLNHHLHIEDVPFPYYGNPDLARVVVLQANPGHDVLITKRDDIGDLIECDYQNLLHKIFPPLYSMMPKYRQWKYTNGQDGICWYWKRTRQIRDILGWEKVAAGMMYLELFPYRSVKLMYPKFLPPSQEYTFYLLRQLLQKNILVIMTRMDLQWLNHVPALRNYPHVIKMKNHRNVYISPKNLGQDNFQLVINSLAK